MNRYYVATINFFDNEIKQFIVEAETELEASKKALVLSTDEKYRQNEIYFQNSEDYPQDMKSLLDYLNNAEMDLSIIQI